MVQSGVDFEKGEDDGTADALAVVLIEGFWRRPTKCCSVLQSSLTTNFMAPSGVGPCDDRCQSPRYSAARETAPPWARSRSRDNSRPAAPDARPTSSR